MRRQHTGMAVILVIRATVDCQVSTTRNIHSLVDETDFPKRVVREARLKALSIGFDPNG